MTGIKTFYKDPYTRESTIKEINLGDVDKFTPGKPYTVETESESTGENVYLIFYRESEVKKGRPVHAYTEEEYNDKKEVNNLETVIKQ